MNILNSLAIDYPEHPPLFYVTLKLWVDWLGSNVSTIRCLSAVVSLLVFPLIYWLCLELFENWIVGFITIALVAVSPFHFIYAQEAREYSLWTVTTLLVCIAFLRAIKTCKRSDWLIYSSLTALNLYTYPFSIFSTAGYVAYIFLVKRLRNKELIKQFLLFTGLGFLAVVPWIVYVKLKFKTVYAAGWTAQPIPLSSLVVKWIGNFSRLFLDFNINSDTKLTFDSTNFLKFFLILFVVILSSYSIFYMLVRAPRATSLFILTMIVFPVLVLALADLILGGQRSSAGRYFVPSYLGIEMAVAYFCRNSLGANFSSEWQRRLAEIFLLFLLVLGTVSCITISQSKFWWNKQGDMHFYQISKIVNLAENPVLVSDNYWNVVPLSYLLNHNVIAQLTVEPNTPELEKSSNTIFLFNPSQTLRSFIEKDYNLHSVYESSKIKLWRLQKKD